MLAKRLKSETIKWYPILSNDLLTTNFKFINYLIATVIDKTKIKNIIEVLNQIYPLSKDCPYKRIRRTILNNKETITDIIITEKINYKNNDEKLQLENYLDNFREISLPKFNVQTRKQYNLVAKYWPLKFHENKEIEILVNNQFNKSINENILEQHNKYANFILKLSKLNSDKSIALIVDSNLDKIVSVGIDERDKHPLNHSTINVLNNVSKKQLISNNLLSLVDDDANDESYKNSEALLKNENDFILDIKEKDETNYLCTNYYAYLTHEPCKMCAMALVHSRISKVFYLFNTDQGYLFTNCKLHTLNNLNHKYQVFKASNIIDGIEEDCEQYFCV